MNDRAKKYEFEEVVIMKRLIAMVLCLLFVISLRRNFKVSYLETVQLQGYGYLLLGQEKFRVPKIDRQNEELD